MYRMLYVALLMTPLLTACVVVPAHRGPEVVEVPALPLIVELGIEPYYYHSGYFYFYNNARWHYSRTRSGPWIDLPRDRYPREIRYTGRSESRGHDRGDGRDNRRGNARDKHREDDQDGERDQYYRDR